MHDSVRTLHGELKFPVFLPDATFGVVRAVDATDLEAARVQGLVMNTFHLMQRPGSSTIQSFGGIHRMSAWEKPIVTDSGGFQAYSLIRQNPKMGKINDKGLTFQPQGAQRKFLLTPEKSIQLQIGYGSDVVICLDDCTSPEENLLEQEKSVRRTITWAKRCKQTFSQLLEEKRLPENERPLIYAVVQGGRSHKLRKLCADALLEIGFDGYGYGGWPIDSSGNLVEDMLGYTREIIPLEYPLHALGVGHPQNVLICYKLGYAIFDSAMPTRDARHGRMYRFESPPDNKLQRDWFSYIYAHDKRHIKNVQPVSEFCDCHTCQNFSMAYLHHLFKMDDALYLRLATIHNLRFMTQLMERIRAHHP